MNDVVPVGANRFYATNDHYFSSAIMKKLEPLIGRPWTNVVYYSPDEVKVVAEGFFMANGINISPEKRFVLNRFCNVIVFVDISKEFCFNIIRM